MHGGDVELCGDGSGAINCLEVAPSNYYVKINDGRSISSK